MNDINTVIMTGRLVDKPDLRGTNGDIMSFTIAVNRSVKDGEGWKDEASFFEWTRYKTSEKYCDMLQKGMLVTCKGSAMVSKFKSSKYKDKDGKEIELSVVKFVCDNRDGLQFALPKKEQSTSGGDGLKGPEAFDEGNDIPF